MHNRCKDYIDTYLESADTPIQEPELRHNIKQNVQLNLSKSMLNRYLKYELGYSYRQIKAIPASHNKPQAKL